jgi:excisionase family DNA binding protein
MPANENPLQEAARITGAEIHARVLAGNHLLRINEVAALLSCSTRTVRNKITSGELPIVPLDDGQKSVRVSMLALADFIEARKVSR